MKWKELLLKRGLILLMGLFMLFGESIAYGSVNKLQANKDSSFISYHVYHVFHSVDGISKNILCYIEIDSSTHRIVSTSVETEVNTFNSGNEARDKTAMKAVESANYPEVKFQSDSIVYDSDTTASVTGKLTFHGVGTEITLPIIVISRTGEIICDGSFHLNFDAFNVERPALIFIPIGNAFIVKFHMVFDLRS